MAMEITSKYSVPEVTVYNETPLAQHETDQSKSCLCTESSLDVEEIKKKLLDYNIDLQTHMIRYYDTFISREHMIKMTKELEELVPCLLTPEILPNLQFFWKSKAYPYIQLIFHHVLAKLNHPARENFIDFENTCITCNRPYHIKIYFDLYCDNTEPEVFFNSIHEVWKYHPYIEFRLRLLCCKRLLKNKHYDILNRLIQNNEEYFLIEHNKLGPDQRYINLWIEYAEYLTVLLILLCNNVTSRQTEKIKTVFLIFSHTYGFISVRKVSEYFILFTLSLKQTRLIPSLIKVLLNTPELHNLSSIIVSLCNERLLEVDCHNTYNKSMDCIKANSHLILNLPFFLERSEFHVRQTHCKLLLTLLHAYVMCEDLTNTDNVLNRLQEFRHSLLQSANRICACFMGEQRCYHREQMFDYRGTTPIFKSSWSLTINDLRKKVIKEKLEPVWNLKPMIDAVEKCLESGEDFLEEFISIIEQISLQKTTGLYDIIKSLCDLKMQPEIQDIFIQGLTDYIHDYIHVKCNKQNSIYSRLLLDINMTCYKGEFLKKLTINMGKLLLIDVDTGNDVEKIIYRCFCIVRHENKEIDIAKYQVYFTFISTMDAEDKMLKMSNLRSFLLMLILLMISSGSQHKSAKLKKYLSLKYAYEDAILYLLWCSGDVEINPGPTRTELEEKAIAVKMRNWTLDMCTITLKLLKNKAWDSKFNGLWIEKPDNWQELNADKPFYNPRKKQKSKQLSVETDKELLKYLLKCCDGKSITLPSNFQREIDAWNSNKVKLLLELCVTRKEINSIKKSIELLIMYRDTAELKQSLKNCNFSISFNHVGRSKDYSDIIRKFAVTFCRISKGLPILKKKDGIWKTPPHDWNPNNLYYDPCNTAKRHEQHLDQKLVDDLLSYCEKKSIPIPSELQLVVKAWKLKNKKEICKHYTIWSSMAVIQHSIKYLEIEGLLEKPDVQQSLKQIGVSLHCEKSSNQHNNDSTIYTDNKSKVSGLPMNSLSNNLRGTYSSSSLCSTRDSDIEFDCSQHPSEAKALTNSHSTKSVIKCSKPEFQNQPSTSSCTIYSKKAPCQDNRIDLQSIDERLEFSDSHTILPEISHEETHFQSSTSSCTTYSKRAPCRENSGDLQYTDERLDIPDSHKCVSEILCQKPDFQPSSSGCSSFIKRPECLNVRENVPSTERIQKRRRPSSEERSDKRPKLHSGNESQASTSSITRCNGVTIPSSHCDSDIADQCVNSTGYMEDSSDQSSNRITPPDNIQDTDSSKDDIFGPEDEIPQHLEEIIDRYIIMSCDNLEENLEENFGEDLEHIDRLFGEDLEHIDRLLKLWETL
ncbi:uncharacterized protein [Mytilus edulis]|uniref:uncharacterized protein n=1 Tax=Mytilus edulis TaxID=6550 RepID=UPI0039F0E513